MEESLFSNKCLVQEELEFIGEDKNDTYQEEDVNFENIVSTLPKAEGWRTEHLVQYQGIWLSPKTPEKIMLIQKHFKTLPIDILLVTSPKAGTTWFKAILFALVNRLHINSSANPLIIKNPHDCVPFLEVMIDEIHQTSSTLNIPKPRLVATHMPYTMLPDSIKSSSCRIVYVFRDPKDVLVSQWHFLTRQRPKELPPLPLEEAFKLFCEGKSHYGPFWDHALEYWKMALESQEKVLFLTYEDMKKTPLIYMKRLAEFLGVPFTREEEENGLVQEIVSMCSFETLSNLEVNKFGVTHMTKSLSIKSSDFFRKGEIGDWKHHLTASMAEALDHITIQKFGSSGLIFPCS